jgi:mannose-6-phosphate isomerase-like protein (cupin superfamily)
MTGQVFSFGTVGLRPERAHQGEGEVLAARFYRQPDAGLRFLDLIDVPPGSTVGRHRHGDDHELYVVVSGRGTVELDGVATAIGPGDVALNVPFGSHAVRCDGEVPLRLVVVCVAPAAG